VAYLDNRALSAATIPITVPMPTPTSTERPLLGYLLDSHLHSPTSSTSIPQKVKPPVQRSHALCPALRDQPIKATHMTQQPDRSTCALLPRCDQLLIPKRLTILLHWPESMNKLTTCHSLAQHHQLCLDLSMSQSLRSDGRP